MSDPIQQQLITARENQILDAAVAVFAEKGFHATTIRNIAQHAGISDGTIYNYFKNKTALLIGIFERMRAAVLQDSPPLPVEEVDFRTFIKSFLRHPLRALAEDDFALFRIMTSEIMVNPELRQLYAERIMEPTVVMAERVFMEQAARYGIALSEDDARLTVRIISSAVMGLLVQHVLGDPVLVERWDDLPDFIAELVLNGLPKQR